MSASSYHFKKMSANSTTSTNGTQWKISTSSWLDSSASCRTRSRSSSPSRCGHDTWDGGACDNKPTFDDGHCHVHTEEQCYAPRESDGKACELSGAYGPDNRCHHHSKGCNEGLTFNNVQKAAFHGMKSAFRWLGMHSDTKRSGGPLEIQPDMAARIAAEVGRAYLNATGEKYDREASHRYLESQGYIDGPRDSDEVKSFRDVWDHVVGRQGEDAVESLKKGIKQAWNQIQKDGKPHADGARTGLAVAEWWFDTEIPVSPE